jgi:membrane-associated phospholipid phosphatase
MTNPSPAWLRQCGPRLAALWPLKFFGLTGGMTAFFYAYFWLLHHPARPPVIMPLTVVDAWVPFMPAALPLYLSLWVYVSLAPALLVSRARLFSYYLTALGLAVSGLLLFYACPTAVPPAGETWAPGSAFAFLKNADASGNACPSLHVAFAVFTAFVLARQFHQLGAGRAARALNGLWCAGIVWSTLATRQHVFLDAAAGSVLGAVFGVLFLRGWRVSPAAPPAE